MSFDPRFKSPGARFGSGDTTPSVAENDSNSASDGEVTPEVGAGGAEETPLVPPAADGAQEPESPAADVDVAALAETAAKAADYLALAQRTKADFENYRKRSMREAAAAQERGAIKLAMALLPAIDNLDRALAHAGDTAENGATFVSGIEHVRSDVIAALGRVGIEPYSPEGEPFDPQFHEAVAQQSVEGAESGTVIEVFQRGYRLGDNVLRPARVVVAG